MTNFVSQKFQWFVDLQTSADSMQVVTITAGGQRVRRRLLPFFAAYKYYKLGSVSVRFVPASTLPVDPTGLSYSAGENTVDPRDQFNPGLVRITNGEDFNVDTALLADDTASQNMYYQLMLDPRWYKFNLQSGFRRKAIPLYWSIGQLHQDVFPGAVQNLPSITKSSSGSVNSYNTGNRVDHIEDSNSAFNYYSGSNPHSIFQVGGKERMGWMPTDAFYDPGNPDLVLGTMAQVPEVELLRVILPKAYKTKFFYRLYIEETVNFKGPVCMYSTNSSVAGSFYPLNQVDRFIYPVMYELGSATQAPARNPINGSDWHNDCNQGGEN
ncbi:cap protein [Human smacovirus 1]|nr:cap protein [Human smacovirus 1]